MKNKLLAILLLLAFAFPARAADVTFSAQTSVNVAATTTAVSARDTRRILVLINMSDTAISCKFGQAAVVSEGIVLNPTGTAGQAGGSIFFDVAVPTGALNCIHGGSGSKAVLITEG